MALHRGPSLPAVASVHAVLFLGSLALTAALSGGGHFPSPLGPDASGWFAAHGAAVRWAAFLQFGSAMPLAIFTATAASRLQFLGVQVAGVHIALCGGLLASGFLAASALAQWVLGQPAGGHALHLAAFAAGGPGCVVPLGLLVAGLALTGGLSGLLPRWMMWTGLVLAGIAELSSLGLVAPMALFLLPLARFPSMVWLIAAGALLPKGRRR